MDDWERVDVGVPHPELMARAGAVADGYEPLVKETEFDDPLNPETVHVYLPQGIRADTSRFDITWTDRGYYRYQYTEGPEFNYRYDRHPRPDTPDNHFHEQPNATHEAVPSCVEVRTVRLVTIAVLQLWRDTVESGNLELLQQPNPP